MSSMLHRWFMSWKVVTDIDEARRNKKTTLRLTNCELKEFSCEQMMKISTSSVVRLLLHQNVISELTEDFGLSGMKLQILSLAYNRLTRLPITFGELDLLTRLNISHNDFSAEGFPLVLCKLKTLRELWANGIGITELPNDVQELTELKLLGLRNNSIGTFPVPILSLGKLEWLTLAGNAIALIPSDLYRLENLIHLNLSYNNISRLHSVPWARIQKLRYVFLEFNNLLVDDKVIRAIQEIPNLAKARLSGNENIGTASDFDGIVTPQTTTRVEVETLWERSSVHSSATDCRVNESSGTIPDFLIDSAGASSNRVSGSESVALGLDPTPGPRMSTSLKSKSHNDLAELNTSNQSTSSTEIVQRTTSQLEDEKLVAGVSSRALGSNTRSSFRADESDSNCRPRSRDSTDDGSLRQTTSLQAPTYTRRQLDNGFKKILVGDKSCRVNKRESEPARVFQGPTNSPDGRIRDELFTVSRTRSEDEVSELIFLPRPACHTTSPISNPCYLETQENLNSLKQEQEDRSSGNVDQQRAPCIPETDEEREPSSNAVLEEVPGPNRNFVENIEDGENHEPELYFIPDQEAQDEKWDHSERSEDLDKMDDVPSDDDLVFQDLPLDEYEENLILYTIMLS